MDYGKLIDKQLTKVFKKAGSLLVTATFHLKEGESYNFGTASPVVADESDKIVQVLVISTEQKAEVVKKKLLIETIPELDTFDKVTLQGQQWKIGATTLDNGHTQMIEVFNG